MATDPPTAGEQADVVVFNTCAVRENADNKLYGNLGHLAPVKAEHPGMQIAVGGCLARWPPSSTLCCIGRLAVLAPAIEGVADKVAQDWLA